MLKKWIEIDKNRQVYRFVCELPEELVHMDNVNHELYESVASFQERSFSEILEIMSVMVRRYEEKTDERT